MDNLTWDDEVTLIGTESYTEDELGQQIPIESKTIVLCCRKPTPRQEKYFARQIGVKISETFIVHPYEYNGENIVEFQGKQLHILKTYPISMEELEITCTEMLGEKDGKKRL